MDIASAIFIASGAAIGMFMLINLLKGHHVPKALTLLHGVLVALGLLLLILFNFANPELANWTSVFLFVLAAFGGVYVLIKDIRHQKVNLLIVFIHGAIAISGLFISALNLYKIHA